VSMEEHADQLIDDALGLLPTGWYLMTASYGGCRCGMIVSSVQRCCDEPALISIAARKGHKIDPLIRDSRSFAVGIVDPSDKLVLRRFSKTDAAPSALPSVGDDDPFDAFDAGALVTGSPILLRCSTWFDCEVVRRVDLEAETELFVGLVVSIWHGGQQITIDRANVFGESD